MMPTTENPPPPEKMTLEDCVRAFLGLALTPPEKEPKQQYRQRENRAQIIGFNRAQEALRTILAEHGAAADVQRLAEVRSEGQELPIKVGNTNAWVVM